MDAQPTRGCRRQTVMQLRNSFGLTTLLLLEHLSQIVQRQQVPGESQPADDGMGGRGGDRAVPELLPGEDLRDVDLDHRLGKPTEGVVERVAGVTQCARVDDDRVGVALLLDLVDQGALVIRLEEDHVASERLRPVRDRVAELGQRPLAVNHGLPPAEAGQVGPVQHQHFHPASTSSRTASTSAAGTWHPYSTRPSSRSSTQRGSPSFAFLSWRRAASRRARETSGSGPSSPYSASSWSWAATVRAWVSPRRRLSLAATFIPQATASPCMILPYPSAASRACPTVW